MKAPGSKENSKRVPRSIPRHHPVKSKSRQPFYLSRAETLDIVRAILWWLEDRYCHLTHAHHALEELRALRDYIEVHQKAFPACLEDLQFYSIIQDRLPLSGEARDFDGENSVLKAKEKEGVKGNGEK